MIINDNCVNNIRNFDWVNNKIKRKTEKKKFLFFISFLFIFIWESLTQS